jgi:hypothetical protein
MRTVPAQATFEKWCRRLHPAPLKVPETQRSDLSSTNVNSRTVPRSIFPWNEFPVTVTQWKQVMEHLGLGGPWFEQFASGRTRNYTVGELFTEVIRGEEDTRRSMHDFYKVVDAFNLDYRRIIERNDRRPLYPHNEVYALPVAAINVFSSPDIVITDGSIDMIKVGLGEVKPPWIVRDTITTQFMNRLPIHDFGNQIVANRDQSEEVLKLCRALTQIYSDLLTDGLSVGFLTTTEFIIYCFIPPEDRTRLHIHLQRIYRAELTSESSPQPGRFTAQVGLAALAWLAKTRYRDLYDKPSGLKTWGMSRPLLDTDCICRPLRM